MTNDECDRCVDIRGTYDVAFDGSPTGTACFWSYAEGDFCLADCTPYGTVQGVLMIEVRVYRALVDGVYHYFIAATIYIAAVTSYECPVDEARYELDLGTSLPDCSPAGGFTLEKVSESWSSCLGSLPGTIGVRLET
ncbi:MAG: hypothetical protein ACYC35_05180 [Pirellulales bacterium]